jgi:hypothetical protein
MRPVRQRRRRTPRVVLSFSQTPHRQHPLDLPS